MKKGSAGMELGNFAGMIHSLEDLENQTNKQIVKQEQYRFQVIKGRMEKKLKEKPKFAQINNKIIFFIWCGFFSTISSNFKIS